MERLHTLLKHRFPIGLYHGKMAPADRKASQNAFMDGDKTATVLGPTVEIEGEIEGEEDLVIQGRIQGKIVSRHDLTVDSSGNVYFGFTETGSNPSGINDGGIARVTPAGVGSYVLAAAAVGQTNDGNWNPALGSSPATRSSRTSARSESCISVTGGVWVTSSRYRDEADTDTRVLALYRCRQRQRAGANE